MIYHFFKLLLPLTLHLFYQARRSFIYFELFHQWDFLPIAILVGMWLCLITITFKVTINDYGAMEAASVSNISRKLMKR